MPVQKRKWKNGICLVLILLSVAAAAVKIVVGFDIDEGYAVSMPARLLQGDRLFRDMWEVHQTSSLLPAFFLFVYQKITGGMDGSVIYLRVIATAIHLGVAIAVYSFLRRKTDRVWSMLLALLYFNFLPKWMMTLDFSMQQVWGLTLCVLLLGYELETGKNSQILWMGIVLACMVLAYPGMVLCYPAFCISLWMLHRREKIKTKINKILLMTAGCAVMAVSFLIYVLSAMSVTELLQSVPMIFMDGTHQFTMQMKLTAYVSQWLNVGKQVLIFLVPTIIISVVIYIAGHSARFHGMLCKCAPKQTTKQTPPEQSGNKTEKTEMRTEKAGILLATVFTVVTSLLIILANIFKIQMGPFHFQVRYLVFFIITFFLSLYSMVRSKGHTEACVRGFLFWGPFFLTAVSFVAILIFSNVGPDASSSYLGIGTIAGWFWLNRTTAHSAQSNESGGEYCGQKEQNIITNDVLWAACALFVLSLIFCKGYYVRITEYGPSTILDERMRIEAGPARGIYVLPEDYERMTADRETIEEVTQNETCMLYLGTEGISNLYAKCPFVSPSTISTPAFNEQWIEYFTRHPEKEPSVIVIAKNTVDDTEAFFAGNPLGRWIADRYDILTMEETDSLCIIRK